MRDTILLDVRYAVRSLARSPVLVVTAIVSIAAGVGVNTAVFSWMDGLVLHPVPAVMDPDRVVGIETISPGDVESPVPFPVFRRWRDESAAFSGMAAWTIVRVASRAESDANATPLLAMAVSGSYFDVLGVRASLGRVVTESDERSRAPVAVLGDEYWKRRYSANPAVIGRVQFLNGLPFTIVGVAPPRFAGTYVGVVPDVYVPMTLHSSLTGQNVLDDRRARAVQVVARLAAGVTRDAAGQSIDSVARRLSREAGDRPVTSATVKDVRTQYLGGLLLPILAATLVSTGLLLLIACANVASLLLVRVTARGEELAVRTALGASPAQLGRHVFTEIVILSIAGGAAGIVAAYLARGTLYALFPIGSLPISLPIELNARVLAFALAAVGLVAVLCGSLPVVRAVAGSPLGALGGGKRTIGRGGGRVRAMVVALQLGVSLVSVVTAGVFIGTLRRAASANVGYSDPRHVLLVTTDLGSARLNDSAAAAAVRQLLAGTRALPGVRAATVATIVPLGVGGVRTIEARVDGYTPAPDESMAAVRIVAGSDYAGTMGMRIVSGRDLTDGDRGGAMPVALVNETFARRFWPNAQPLGRRIDVGHGWATIVGVVTDGKYGSLTEPPQLAVYVAIEQWPQRAFTITVRTATEPLALVRSVGDVLWAINRDLPIVQPRTLAEHASGATFVPRIGARVLGAFAATALALAALGLYGALASAVALRTPELAIRIALGATGRAILWSVGRPAVSIGVAGLATGTVLSVLAIRALEARLGLDPPDAGVYATAVVVLGASIILAAWRPASRALRIDARTAMRNE